MKEYYHKQLHQNGVLVLFINPFYFARKELFISIKKYASCIKGKILDVGCGKKPYKILFADGGYIGIEIDTKENRNIKKADYYYDGEIMPFPDASFDGLLCNQVFEHVFTPGKFISELNRVLKTGGKLIISVPFIWDEQEQPRDFAQYSYYGLRYLLEGNGFEILSHDKTGADLSTIFQLINAYIYKILQTKYISINLLFTFVLIAPVNIFGLIISKLLTKNPDLYLDNVVLAIKRK